MGYIGARVERLGGVLARIVACGLILSYFIPGFFEGAAKGKAVDFVLFLHIFLPAWGWGCYSFMRSRYLPEEQMAE